MKEVIPQSAEAFMIPTLDSSSLSTMLNYAHTSNYFVRLNKI